MGCELSQETIYVNFIHEGSKKSALPVLCKMSKFLDSEPKQSTWAFMPVYKLLETSHILPLIPNSKNNLKRRPSIQTVSEALRTSKKQVKTFLPRSIM